LDVQLADFDGVSFHISTPPEKESRHLVTISIAWPVAPQLLQHGAQAELQRLYGKFLQPQPENGYHVSLLLNIQEIAASEQDAANVPRHVALLKRHLLAGPFLKAFASINDGSANGSLTQLDYRADECLFIKPEQDRCIVIFSISFKDPDDQLFAKVFLQEFKEARRSVRSAPAVTFSQTEAPLELANVAAVQGREDLGFVSFVLFKNHLDPKNAHGTIDMIQTFRDYLHYHIKCSKAYMHERMRNRVALLLQVLNRAKPDPVDPKAKKVWGGKTFSGPGASKSLGVVGGRGRGRGRGRGFAR
jgi:actin related protein 2/3 complex, subunit 2